MWEIHIGYKFLLDAFKIGLLLIYGQQVWHQNFLALFFDLSP